MSLHWAGSYESDEAVLMSSHLHHIWSSTDDVFTHTHFCLHWLYAHLSPVLESGSYAVVPEHISHNVYVIVWCIGLWLVQHIDHQFMMFADHVVSVNSHHMQQGSANQASIYACIDFLHIWALVQVHVSHKVFVSTQLKLGVAKLESAAYSTINWWWSVVLALVLCASELCASLHTIALLVLADEDISSATFDQSAPVSNQSAQSHQSGSSAALDQLSYNNQSAQLQYISSPAAISQFVCSGAALFTLVAVCRLSCNVSGQESAHLCHLAGDYKERLLNVFRSRLTVDPAEPCQKGSWPCYADGKQAGGISRYNQSDMQKADYVLRLSTSHVKTWDISACLSCGILAQLSCYKSAPLSCYMSAPPSCNF